MTFTPHPKKPAKPKKPGSMRSKAPKKVTTVAASDTTINVSAMEPGQTIKITKKGPKSAAAPKPAGGTSKTEMLMAMLMKPGGASSKEMEAATGWAPHSVRGFLGTLRKKGTNVVSKKFGKGEPTVYSIEASHEIPPPPPQPDAPPVEDPGEVV